MAGPPEGRRSRRDWGWHPLTEDWARRIVDGARIQVGDLVLDIGAGDGALTRPLLAAGARVIAVELHEGRLRSLRDLASHEPRLTVVRGDATDLWLPRRPFRAVANPPYAGATAILTRLTAAGSRLVDAHLVLQRQLARRLEAGGGSAALRRGYGCDVVRTMPRSAFRSPPRVDSVVLRVARRPIRLRSRA